MREEEQKLTLYRNQFLHRLDFNWFFNVVLTHECEYAIPFEMEIPFSSPIKIQKTQNQHKNT